MTSDTDELKGNEGATVVEVLVVVVVALEEVFLSPEPDGGVDGVLVPQAPSNTHRVMREVGHLPITIRSRRRVPATARSL